MSNGLRKSQINVAFIINTDKNWMGGINYFKNLINIILEYKNYGITPFLFVPKDCDDDIIALFYGAKVIKTDVLTKKTLARFVNKFCCNVFKRAFVMESLLAEYKIDVISHVGTDYFIKNIPVIGWIPDFQHKYLPEYFDDKEIMLRNKTFTILSRICKRIILSSYDSQKDFFEFYGNYKHKADVLQFVSPINVDSYNSQELRDMYDIRGRFFFVANQFWAHKNHIIILEALRKVRNEDIKVVCSGNISDYRNKNYFTIIKEYIKTYSLEKKFHILGSIPYEDVKALMLECDGMINPSLFEGWNTMVEEARSIGKRIILSDLPVHIEQNPPMAVFFDRNSSADLAAKMDYVWELPSESKNVQDIVVKKDISIRKIREAETFRHILEKAIK